MIRYWSGYPLLTVVFFGLAVVALLEDPTGALTDGLAGASILLGLLCLVNWRLEWRRQR